MCTPIRLCKLANIIINNHDNSVYLVNLYTVSADSLVIMPIFLIYSLGLCWGIFCNNNVTMKFAQLHYFLSQNIGRDKIYYVPLSKSWGGHVRPRPPINSVPGYHCIFKTFRRCFVNVYRYYFKYPARNEDLFFCSSFFCFNNTNTSVRSFIFSLLTTVLYL